MRLGIPAVFSRALGKFSYLLFTLVNRCERKCEVSLIRGLIARISAKRTVKKRNLPALGAKLRLRAQISAKYIMNYRRAREEGEEKRDKGL